MNRQSLVVALILGAASTLGVAQQPTDVPKLQCEPKPKLPGSTIGQDPMVRKRFQGDLDAYKKCMTDYLDARKASIKAHEVAANAAIEEYNGTMKALADAQKAQ